MCHIHVVLREPEEDIGSPESEVIDKFPAILWALGTKPWVLCKSRNCGAISTAPKESLLKKFTTSMTPTEFFHSKSLSSTNIKSPRDGPLNVRSALNITLFLRDSDWAGSSPVSFLQTPKALPNLLLNLLSSPFLLSCFQICTALPTP